jgi:DNA-binding beta-propeller fold protein YncE
MAVSVGAGKFGYEVAEGWGELPDGFEWGQIGAVSVDSKDRVHMFTRTNHPVMTFERDGKFVSTWGEDIFGDAHGMYLDKEDNLFAVDRAGNKAMKFTKDRKLVFELGNKGQASDTGYTADHKEVLQAAGPFNSPTDVALSANGDFYISDGYGNCRVHKFSADGQLLFSWGEPGTGPGQFNLVHSVWEVGGKVYVADRQNNRIQIFTPEGEYIDEWGGFLQPCDLFVDSDNTMYVAELQARVTILDLNGTVLATIGDPEVRKPEPGLFIGPHGVWVDRHGDLYVSEVLMGQRIQKFIRK